MNRSDLQDALKNGNVRAFLKAIRLGEGTSGPLGYWTIVGGGTFTDDSHHPNVRVFIPRYKVHSTAAGAYQIIRGTWENLVKQYGFPDFSPDCQDEAAVALIVGRGALDEVISGDFAGALRRCAPEWASLPGSTAGQRTEKYEDVLKVYTDAGGTVAA